MCLVVVFVCLFVFLYLWWFVQFCLFCFLVVCRCVVFGILRIVRFRFALFVLFVLFVRFILLLIVCVFSFVYVRLVCLCVVFVRLFGCQCLF